MNRPRLQDILPHPGRGRRLLFLGILLIALLFLSLGGLWIFGKRTLPTAQTAGSEGPGEFEEKAPDFVLRDLRGQRYRLSDHRGKRPVLIIFSTTWCTFCKSEIPHFKSLQATYGPQGLEIVNIDIEESQAKVTRFATQHQIPYRILLDEDGTVSGIYEIRGVPSMVLVDQEGKIVCRQCQGVEPLIEAALKK